MMMRWLKITSLLVAAGLIVSAAPQPSSTDVALSPRAAKQILPGTNASPRLVASQPIPDRELEAMVDGALGDAMAADHIEGASVSVVQNGKLVLLKGYGTARQNPYRPVDPNRTLFRIGSISKTFTWILLMREVERGRVKIDAPVNLYLPERLRIPQQGFKRPIRIADLMSHASGFEDLALGRLFVDEPGEVISAEDYLVRNRPKRVREPGLVSSYCNYGTALAAVIVARLNKMDYETLVERDILKPLRMDRTTFREPYGIRADLPAPMPAALAADVADGFDWRDSDFQPQKFEFISQIAGVGGASTTAADMARYMLAQLNEGSLEGAAIYGPKAAASFRTPIMKVADGMNGWAHGFFIESLPGGFKAFGHGGATMSFLSFMMVVPDLDLGVFVTTNTPTSGRAIQLLPRLIVKHFYAAADGAARPAPDPVLAKQAGLYEGRYLGTRRAADGLEKFLGLMMSIGTVSVTPDGYLKTSMGNGQTWVPDGEAGRFREVEGYGLLKFDFGADGRATGFRLAQNGSYMNRANMLMNPQLLAFLALLTVFAAIATWIGALTHWKQTTAAGIWQVRSGKLSLGVSAAWVTALVAMAIFMLFVSTNEYELFYDWPDPSLTFGSIAALAAGIGSLLLFFLLPLIWKEGSWPLWRKIRHTIVVLIFIAFAFLAASWGALTPWT